MAMLQLGTYYYIVPGGGTYYSNVNIDNDGREQHCGKLLFPFMAPQKSSILYLMMIYGP